jgi:hypothetical protein
MGTLRPTRRGWHPDDIVDSFLLDDETDLLAQRISLRAWAINQAPLVVVGLVVAVVALVVLGAGPGAVVVLFLLTVGVVVGVRAVQASYTRYVITDLRVLRVSGVLNRNAEFIPWKKVTDVSRRESVWQWLMGSATIRIESANERSGFRAMTDVRDPDGFYRLLVDMIDRHSGRVDLSGLVGEPGQPPGSSIPPNPFA